MNAGRLVSLDVHERINGADRTGSGKRATPLAAPRISDQLLKARRPRLARPHAWRQRAPAVCAVWRKRLTADLYSSGFTARTSQLIRSM